MHVKLDSLNKTTQCGPLCRFAESSLMFFMLKLLFFSFAPVMDRVNYNSFIEGEAKEPKPVRVFVQQAVLKSTISRFFLVHV